MNMKINMKMNEQNLLRKAGVNGYNMRQSERKILIK